MTNTIWGHSHTHKLGPILKALNHRATEREANNTHCLRLSSIEKRIFLLSKRRGYLWGGGERGRGAWGGKTAEVKKTNQIMGKRRFSSNATREGFARRRLGVKGGSRGFHFFSKTPFFSPAFPYCLCFSPRGIRSRARSFHAKPLLPSSVISIYPCSV